MKKTSTVLYILRLTLTLLVITGTMAAALAGVNAVTAPRIAASAAEKTQQAVSAVLPGGGSPVAFTDDTGTVSQVYGSDTGYAVEVTPQGFGGAVTMMVGIDKEGKVLDIRIISHAETPGLGAVAAGNNAAGQTFRAQFAGLSGIVAVDKDGGEVIPLTGATITSRAVCAGVNAALDCVANLG